MVWDGFPSYTNTVRWWINWYIHGYFARSLLWKDVGSFSSNFADIVTIGERIENGLKLGNIARNATQKTIAKKPHGGFSKKKEGDTSVVMTNVHPHFQAPMAPMSFSRIHILLPLSINNILFNINLRIKFNNLLMLSILNINSLYRLNLLIINNLLSTTKFMYPMLSWYLILSMWGMLYQKRFHWLFLLIMPDTTLKFHVLTMMGILGIQPNIVGLLKKRFKTL